MLEAVLFLSALSLPQAELAFPPRVYAERRSRLAAEIGGEPIIIPGEYRIRADQAKQDPAFWYLTGVESPYALLVIVGSGSSRKDHLFLPDEHQFAGAQYPMEDTRFRLAVWNRPARRLVTGESADRSTGMKTHRLEDFTVWLEKLASGRKRLFFAGDGGSLYAPSGLKPPLTIRQQLARSIADLVPGVSLEDATPYIDRLRTVKDEWEIEALRRAAEISVKSLIEAMKATRPGMNDREIAGLMEYVWKKEGSIRPSFGPIVGSGTDAMTLFTLRAESYNAVDRIMQPGDLLFVDYGAAEHRMYASDLCRTWPVSGRFTPDQKKYYEIVLEAQQAAIQAVRPGVMMLEVIQAAAGVFRRHGLEEFEDIDRMGVDRVWGVMPSPTHYLARGRGLTDYSAGGTGVRDLGHHIGLEATDGRDYRSPLMPGMVFTVEPKLYIPEKNIAIMIEDMILVTEEGYENLSAGAPRTVEDIERVMNDGS